MYYIIRFLEESMCFLATVVNFHVHNFLQEWFLFRTALNDKFHCFLYTLAFSIAHQFNNFFFGMIMSYETNIQMKVKSGEQIIGEKHSFNHKWWFFFSFKAKMIFRNFVFWELLNVEWRKKGLYVEKFDLPNKSEFLFFGNSKSW